MPDTLEDYLNYLHVSGALDENRDADRRAPRRSPTIHADPRDVGGEVYVAPGERLQIPGQGDVTEPLLGPGDLWGPIAAKLGKETADLLVPYLMQSVSRMAPLLGEAQQAAQAASRGGKGWQRPAGATPGTGGPRTWERPLFERPYERQPLREPDDIAGSPRWQREPARQPRASGRPQTPTDEYEAVLEAVARRMGIDPEALRAGLEPDDLSLYYGAPPLPRPAATDIALTPLPSGRYPTTPEPFDTELWEAIEGIAQGRNPAQNRDTLDRLLQGKRYSGGHSDRPRPHSQTEEPLEATGEALDPWEQRAQQGWEHDVEDPWSAPPGKTSEQPKPSTPPTGSSEPTSGAIGRTESDYDTGLLKQLLALMDPKNADYRDIAQSQIQRNLGRTVDRPLDDPWRP